MKQPILTLTQKEQNQIFYSRHQSIRKNFTEKEMNSIINKIFKQLTDKQKLILKLRHVNHLDNENIANLLNINPTATSIISCRPYSKIRDYLELLTNDSLKNDIGHLNISEGIRRSLRIDRANRNRKMGIQDDMFDKPYSISELKKIPDNELLEIRNIGIKKLQLIKQQIKLYEQYGSLL